MVTKRVSLSCSIRRKLGDEPHGSQHQYGRERLILRDVGGGVPLYQVHRCVGDRHGEHRGYEDSERCPFEKEGPHDCCDNEHPSP